MSCENGDSHPEKQCICENMGRADKISRPQVGGRLDSMAPSGLFQLYDSVIQILILIPLAPARCVPIHINNMIW